MIVWTDVSAERINGGMSRTISARRQSVAEPRIASAARLCYNASFPIALSQNALTDRPTSLHTNGKSLCIVIFSRIASEKGRQLPPARGELSAPRRRQTEKVRCQSYRPD